jgi:hypothetical protein
MQRALPRGPLPLRPKKLTSSPNENFGRDGSGRRRRLFFSELPCQFGGLLFAGVDHIDSAAIPRVFERKRHDFPDTDES